MEGLSNKLVYLVDDDPFWTGMLTQLLKNLGITNIIAFSSGTEGLKHLDKNPDLIFLDYEMPELNGLETLEQIKAQLPHCGVIFCTGYEDLLVATDALEGGSFDYLLKSNATEKELKGILKNLVEMKF